MKKVSVNELANKIIELGFNEKFDFKEGSEKLVFGVQRLNWNDNDIILIGGYASHVYSIDLTFTFDTEEKFNLVVESLKENYSEYIDNLYI
jgi:hypothetical protein